MTTKKQIKTNKQNSALSTGPKTNNGKAIVSKNAIQHGILCKSIVLEDESQREFEGIKKAFHEQFKPVGFLEVLFTERVLSAIWRISRISRIEATIIDDAATSPFIKNKLSNAFGGYAGKKLDLMCRYETSLEKILFKSLNELRSLQFSRQSLENQKDNSEIGFVSQL